MTIGQRLQHGQDKSFKTVAIVASLIVYFGMLLYSGVHNFSLMTKGVAPDLIVWAMVGVIALEISAAALPLSLHWWFHSSMQRIVGFTVYGVDLLLIILNVILDFGMIEGMAVPGWLSMYLQFGVPVTPIIAGLGWSILWLLDPSQLERSMVASLRAQTQVSMMEAISEAAKHQDFSVMVDEAAMSLARNSIEDTLGEVMLRNHTGRTVGTRPALRTPMPATALPSPTGAPVHSSPAAVAAAAPGGGGNGHQPMSMARVVGTSSPVALGTGSGTDPNASSRPIVLP